MFGMGGSEIIVILVVALLFLGPDKLPQAAKSLSKGIRDIKKQSRSLQQQIESDEQIGGAIRDLKSALRGEELPVRPKQVKPRPKKELIAGTENTIHGGAELEKLGEPEGEKPFGWLGGETPESPAEAAELQVVDAEGTERPIPPSITLPASAGERDASVADGDDSEELAAMIKPAPGTVAKGS
jgi:sec-independent protein translocase protein TatB